MRVLAKKATKGGDWGAGNYIGLLIVGQRASDRAVRVTSTINWPSRQLPGPLDTNQQCCAVHSDRDIPLEEF